MYTNDRNAYRQMFFTVWQKYQKKLALNALEAQLLEVILLHPEYQVFLEKPHLFQQQEFALEENPFLHMSLHVTLREQIQHDRPKGIRGLHQALQEKYPLTSDLEHRMMVCLTEILWQAQQSGHMPSEEDYLQSLKQL